MFARVLRERRDLGIFGVEVAESGVFGILVEVAETFPAFFECLSKKTLPFYFMLIKLKLNFIVNYKNLIKIHDQK